VSFIETLRRARQLLQEEGRLSLRALRREFDLDEEALEELVEELVAIQRVAVRDGRALAWGGGGPTGPAESPAPERAPRDYTPKHLADKILQSRSVIEGERKHVTVLFADVPGSVPLAERIGPDEMHALMDRCFECTLDAVHRYEGTVNQFTGDGVMALFGAPLALEDSPRRAVLAALDIQRALERVADEVRSRHGSELRMRIGIHTGLVVVGKIGDDLRMDYTAVGDTTNLANRLQGLARPGAIVLSWATEQLVRGFFELRDLGPADVKGKSEPVRIFEVLAERPVSGRLEAVAPSDLTPFVGRVRDLDALWAAFESARDGRGQVAFVVGEAGLGKSRLLDEFRRRLGGEPHTWIEGHCASLARTTPFGAIVDALRRRFGIEDLDDETSALAKIERVQGELGRDLDWTLPFVHQLLSLHVGDPDLAGMDAATRRSEAFRALQALFLRAAAQEPLVLVVEDLHWIDAASEDLLAYLSDSIPATRALLVLTHRPGYTHPFGDRSYHMRIALQALPEAEIAMMAGALLETTTVPDSVRRLIAEKADGNPFFVEEVTKSLLEQGILRLRKGAIRMEAEPAEVRVPHSIQGVLMARLDRLAEEPKRAIQVASVIGREFALRLLERISEASGRVGALVEELRALELIYQKAAHPELAFMFKHALTHDVAYESIVLPRRRELHRIVGTAIEELYRDRLPEHYEALALHFTRGEDWERAFAYHEWAADKAAAAYASHSAIEHYRQALAIAERLGDRVPDLRRQRLEQGLAAACHNVSEFRQSAEACLRASGLSEDGGERAALLGLAAGSFLQTHDYARARETAAEALTLARTHRSYAAQSIALQVQSHQARTEGDLSQGHLADEAARLAELSGYPMARIVALGTTQAQWASFRGEFRRALALSEEALEIAVDARVGVIALWSNWWLGLSAGCLGQYDRAIATFRTACELSDRIGDRALKARLLNSLGWCLAEIDCHSRAREYNERSLALAREMVEAKLLAAAPEIYANAGVNLASNRLGLGDPDGARELLEPLQAELDCPGDPNMRWRYSLHVLDGLARVALAKGDPERTLALTREESVRAKNVQSPKLEARALELQGRAFATLDRRDEAEAALRSALEIAGRIEYPPVVWRARSLLAELARRRGNHREADTEAVQARALVEGLARELSEPELRREFGALGERLVADPLGAYR
jgi:class 3 adenylate cyclase/tetratricopeptide (TPR) repeat protein